MKVIGIDPGTAILGWAVAEKNQGRLRAQGYGVIVTPAHGDPSQRLMTIHTKLHEVIAEHRPTWAAVEKLYFGQNSTTAMAVGQARGVVLLALAQTGLPYVEMTPNEVKQAVTGYGRAEKKQMQLMVQRLFGLSETPHPDDAADALAIALTGLEQIRFRRVLNDC